MSFEYKLLAHYMPLKMYIEVEFPQPKQQIVAWHAVADMLAGAEPLQVADMHLQVFKQHIQEFRESFLASS